MRDIKSYKKLSEITQDIFAPVMKEFNCSIIGSDIYFPLDERRIIIAQLYNSWCRDQWDNVRLFLKDKFTGELDSKAIGFSKIFESSVDLSHPNKIGKHIWQSGGRYSWYGQPTREDISAMNDVVRSYILMWK